MDRVGRTALLSEAAWPTRQHYKILAMASAGWLFDFYDLLLYSFLLIPIGAALRLTPLELSYLLGASLAATAVGGVLFGWLADRWGRKTVLTWTILTYSVGTLLSGLAPNFLGLFLARLLTGIVTGVGTGLFSGYGPLFTELFPTAIRNTAMGAAFNLARGVQFFTPVVITPVARHYGLEGGIALAILFALLTGAGIWTLPETKGAVLRR